MLHFPTRLRSCPCRRPDTCNKPPNGGHAHEREHTGDRISNVGRELVSGLGPVQIRQPRVVEPRTSRKGRYRAVQLCDAAKYLRRAPSVDNLIPTLYPKGISAGDFQIALASILGEGVVGLSAANITRLKRCWVHKTANTRDRMPKSARAMRKGRSKRSICIL